MHILKKSLLLVVVFSLAACATNIGNRALEGATEASINSWIIDGQTTKATVNEKMGVYVNEITPSLERMMICTPEKRICSYSYLDGSSKMHWKLAVSYDEKNVVKSHTLRVGILAGY